MSMRHCASISDSPCLRHVEDPSTPGTGWIGAIRAPPRAPPAPPPRRRGGGAHCSLEGQSKSGPFFSEKIVLEKTSREDL